MRFVWTAMLGVIGFAAVATAAPPKVVMSTPDDGDDFVSADVKELRIEFDQPMNPRGRSIVGGGEAMPKINGEIRWADEKTIVVPIALKPDHAYALNINSDTFTGFRNNAGEPAEWYPISFKTRGDDGPKDVVTREQNVTALAALRKTIDDDYSYRDRKHVDWPAEIDRQRTAFENAKTANEFARLTAHLLRHADDAHVSVKAGEVTIGTRANSAAPNFNLDLLAKILPHWTELPGGLISGRFDDANVGYLLMTECSDKQADAFEDEMVKLKDTNGLILDARMNGGGDELAAKRIAQWFTNEKAVYARDRIRENGQWTEPIDRTIEPRGGGARYERPVVVLIGPKVVSSAESFVLMMKHGAKAKLIGERTGGSSARPLPHALGNGVTVFLPSWEDQRPDGTMIEGVGVRPDVRVTASLRELQETDPVLAAAIKLLHEDAGATTQP